jgi:O-antigen/teichoic acid export membrane protein
MVSNSILLLLIGLEQHGYLSTIFYSASKIQLRSAVSSISLISSFLFALILLLVFGFSDSISSLVQISAKWIILAVIVAFFQVIAQLNLTIWQLESKPAVYGWLQVSSSLLNYVLSILLVVVFDFDEGGRMIGITVAAMLFGTIGFLTLKRKELLEVTFKSEYVKASMLFSLPLIPHALAGWVNTGLDRILINNFVSVSENGIYSISYQVAMLVGMVASSFNRAFAPFIFKRLSENGESLETKIELVKYTYMYYIALTVIALLIYVSSPVILSLLVDSAYHDSGKYVIWIMLGFLFDGYYYGVVNYLFFTRKTHYISLVTSTSCLIHFLISYLVIPSRGAIGAAYASFASYLFSFVVTFYVCNRYSPMPWGTYLRSVLFLSRSK